MTNAPPPGAAGPLPWAPNAYGAYQPPAAPPRPPTDGVSVAGFVLALLGFLVITLPFAFVLNVLGIVRTAGHRRRGRPFAVIGLVITIGWVVLFAAAVWFVLANIERDADGNVTGFGSIRFTQLSSGDCIETFSVGSVARPGDVPVVPCEQPHGAQVIDEFEVPGEVFPGEESLGRTAEKGCADRLGAALARRVSAGELGLGYYHPQQASWAFGDRTVYCVITARPGEQLTETFSIGTSC
jgi:hypothetical protein